MSRKRKPTRKPFAAAAEALRWRSIVLLEAIGSAAPLGEPIKRLQMALDDFDASREPEEFSLLICESCKGTCLERRNGLCNRCFDAQIPAGGEERLLTFMQS
jgi:hypothetical protein